MDRSYLFQEGKKWWVLVNNVKMFRVHNVLGISWRTEELLDSEEGLRSVELVSGFNLNTEPIRYLKTFVEQLVKFPYMKLQVWTIYKGQWLINVKQ